MGCGTTYYQPPEYIKSIYDEDSDLYAAGLVLLDMCMLMEYRQESHSKVYEQDFCLLSHLKKNFEEELLVIQEMCQHKPSSRRDYTKRIPQWCNAI